MRAADDSIRLWFWGVTNDGQRARKAFHKRMSRVTGLRPVSASQQHHCPTGPTGAAIGWAGHNPPQSHTSRFSKMVFLDAPPESASVSVEVYLMIGELLAMAWDRAKLSAYTRDRTWAPFGTSLAGLRVNHSTIYALEM